MKCLALDVLVGNQVELPEQIVADDFLGDEGEPAGVVLDEEEAGAAISRLLADALQQQRLGELSPAVLIDALEMMVAEFSPIVDDSPVARILTGRLDEMVTLVSDGDVGLKDRFRLMVLLNRLHQVCRQLIIRKVV